MIVLLQTLSGFVVVTDNLANKGCTTKALGVNKENAKMHCNGKCYLAKQLQHHQKQGQQAPSHKKLKTGVHLFKLSETLQFTIRLQEKNDEHIGFCVPLLSSFPAAVFHPPTVKACSTTTC